MGEDAFGINRATIVRMVEEAEVVHMGVQVAVVIGGGNISAASPAARSAWTAPPPTTWACWPR